MESLANSVAKMLLGEHIVQQDSFSDTILLWRHGDHTVENFGWVSFGYAKGVRMRCWVRMRCSEKLRY